jgi:hypothetical protein
VRFNTNALLPANLAQLPGGGVEMQLFVVDVDDSVAHEAKIPACAVWRSAFDSLLGALWAAHPGFVTFQTRGGARLLWRLEVPIVLRSLHDASVWTARYGTWIAQLKRFGIDGDAACADWTRLFRLPFVRRDDQDERRPIMGDLSASAWPIGDMPVVPERHGRNAAAEFPDDLSDRIDHSAVARLLAQFCVSGQNMHRMARAVGGFLCNRGFSSIDAATVVLEMAELAGSTDPGRRAADAESPFRERTPAGWSELEKHVSLDVLRRLECAVPDLLEARRRAQIEALKAQLLLVPQNTSAPTPA